MTSQSQRSESIRLICDLFENCTPEDDGWDDYEDLREFLSWGMLCSDGPKGVRMRQTTRDESIIVKAVERVLKRELITKTSLVEACQVGTRWHRDHVPTVSSHLLKPHKLNEYGVALMFFQFICHDKDGDQDDDWQSEYPAIHRETVRLVLRKASDEAFAKAVELYEQSQKQEEDE